MNRALFGLALFWIAVMLHRGQPLGWDELEFFRATKWVGEGQVPFRDFWEHHTPLQWLVFAPIARLADGPGADAIVMLRWAQAAVWVGILALTTRLGARWPSFALLLASPLFVRSAIEYRVDVLGNLGFIAALVVATRQRWVVFGALMSLAVLANMRLAPLVVVTALLFFFWCDERWQWNPHAARMLAGVAAVALPFVALLKVTNAWQPFLDGVIQYNIASSGLIEVSTFSDMLLAPFWLLDPAAMALWAAAIAGCVMAIRKPIAIVFLASIVTIAAMEVHYEYHFQGTYLLMLPLATLAIERVARWRWVVYAVAAVAMLINLLPLASPSFGEPMRYQDFVMREVDRRTRPGDVVFDGTAYALNRKPAYRYWFLPAGLRFLAASGGVAPYDITASPPAAIIYNLRMHRWFEIFPRTATYAVRHYVPLTRDLWVPGMTAIATPGRAVAWTAPAAGRYTLHASEPLVRHPWLTRPLELASLQGPRATRYSIPLRRLPPARVQWSVDGTTITGTTVDLKRGARVTIVSEDPRPVGVLLVPHDVATLCVAPAQEFQF